MVCSAWKHAKTNDAEGELAFIDLIVRSGVDSHTAERGDILDRKPESTSDEDDEELPEPDHDLDLFQGEPDETQDDDNGNRPQLLVLMETNLKISMALLEVFQRVEKKVDFLVQELGYQEKK